MNEIEKRINVVIDVVVECCCTNSETETSITKEDVLGKSKKENANIARSMLAHYLLKEGFSVSTIAFLFGRSQQTIRNLVTSHDGYVTTSKAYRIANEQIKTKLNASN